METVCAGKIEKKRLSNVLGTDEVVVGERFFQNQFTRLYKASCGDYDELVLKWSSFDMDWEVECQNKAAEVGLSLPVLETWKCTAPFQSSAGYVMPWLEATLKEDLYSIDQLEEVKRYVYEQIEAVLRFQPIVEKIKKMHEEIRSATDLMDVKRRFERFEKRYKTVYGITLPRIHKMNIKESEHQKQFKRNAVFQCMRLLDGLHQIGLEHGDAHLSNFMRNDSRYYLIDFGATIRMGEEDEFLPDNQAFPRTLRELIDDAYGSDDTFPIRLDMGYLLEVMYVLQTLETEGNPLEENDGLWIKLNRRLGVEHSGKKKKRTSVHRKRQLEKMKLYPTAVKK